MSTQEEHNSLYELAKFPPPAECFDKAVGAVLDQVLYLLLSTQPHKGLSRGIEFLKGTIKSLTLTSITDVTWTGKEIFISFFSFIYYFSFKFEKKSYILDCTLCCIGHLWFIMYIFTVLCIRSTSFSFIWKKYLIAVTCLSDHPSDQLSVVHAHRHLFPHPSKTHRRGLNTWFSNYMISL